MNNFMEAVVALERRLEALEANRGASLRFCQVTSVNKDGSARVKLLDGDQMVSSPLRILQRRTLKDKEQCFPDVGEQVACLFAGQGLEAGVILGAVYSEKDRAPGQEPPMCFYRFEDGTELSYDRARHRLTFQVQGRVELSALQDITLRAPNIRLEGNLSQRGHDGGAASSELRGSYQVIEGSIAVPDGEVTAGGVGLREHGHENVENGPDVSGPPEGGSGRAEPGPGDLGYNSLEVWESLFYALEEMLYQADWDGERELTPKDELMLCLPYIAGREAERRDEERDRIGWNHLKSLFHKWFSGPANTYADGNPEPYWVDWDWVMSFDRAREEYEDFIKPESAPVPGGEPKFPIRRILDLYARESLGKILLRDMEKELAGLRPGQSLPFIHATVEWQKWQAKYHTRRTVYRAPNTDGLMAAMAGFNLRALADGSIMAVDNGKFFITVTKVAVYAMDRFDFPTDRKWLGYWDCKKGEVYLFGPWDDIFSFSPGNVIDDGDFNDFRKKHGYGNDFLTLSNLHTVENFTEVSYVYP